MLLTIIINNIGEAHLETFETSTVIRSNKQKIHSKTQNILLLYKKGNQKNTKSSAAYILKPVLGQTNDSEIPPLEVGNEIIPDNKEKANAFSKFFSDVTNLNDENAEEPDDLMYEDAHGRNSVTITEQDVLDQLSTLDVNKAYGQVEIPPRFLKEAAREITPSLMARSHGKVEASQTSGRY